MGTEKDTVPDEAEPTDVAAELADGDDDSCKA
jgi:hypothetical protein